MLTNLSSYGVVAIGRNEGERLRRCLSSLDPALAPLVYVDSGSSDDSVAMATAMGATVVVLDPSLPFSAARARNDGFARLLALDPTLAYVQFVDGDCEVVAGWIDHARAFLDAHPRFVAISGLNHERHPERSIYNTLCDIDWRWTLGETDAFGGNVLLRAAALQAVGGFDPTLIAGEEPELSLRLRRAGWKIWQDRAPMTLHDANLLHFRQWWRRCLRSGFAVGQGAALHGAAPERHGVRERRSALFWGVALPLLALAATASSRWLALALLGLYPVQMMRIYLASELPPRLAGLMAVFRVIGKFPEGLGVLKFAISHRKGVTPRLIEYK